MARQLTLSNSTRLTGHSQPLFLFLFGTVPSVLTDCATVEEVYKNLPDIELLPVVKHAL